LTYSTLFKTFLIKVIQRGRKMPNFCHRLAKIDEKVTPGNLPPKDLFVEFALETFSK
jgi:hypothetical protein